MLLVAVVACTAPSSSSPTSPVVAAGSGVAAGARTVTTRAGRYRIDWAPTPDPIPLSELFEVHATLADAATGAPVASGAVHVNATMPQHGHGMTTRPEDDPGECAAGGCTHPGGIYVTRGMKLHMPGAWVLRFDVAGPAGPDDVEVPLAL